MYRFPGVAALRGAAGPAARLPGLRARLRLHRLPVASRAGAERAAGGDRLGTARLLVSERALAAGRGADAGLRLLSLRLPAGADRLRPAVGDGLSRGAHAGAGAVGGVRAGEPADGAAGDRRRACCSRSWRRSPTTARSRYFNVRTFSTGIYQAWFAMQDRAAAAQLALCLLGFALVARGARAGPARAGALAHARRRGWPGSSRSALAGGRGAGVASVFCLAAGAGGLPAPGGDPRDAWRPDRGRASLDPRYLRFVGNSLTLAGVAAVVTVVGAVLVGFRARMRPGRGVAGAGARRPGSATRCRAA